MTRVLVIANDEGTILNFRCEILQTFVREKFEVIVCYPLGEHTDVIKNIGCKVINLEVSRHGTNVLNDLRLLENCKNLIVKYKPDVVLTYTVKPNVYGSLACQFTNTPYINNVTGLGSVLQSKSLLSKFVLLMQKFAYRKSSCVFFQNNENSERLKQLGVVTKNTPIKILPGSGVNLEKQTYEDYPEDDGITRFIIVSRVRVDKGYQEFFDAAESIKGKYPNTEFHVVGWYEEVFLRNRLDDLNERGILIYHGKKLQSEVHQIIKKCNCIIHPSYHEGMANVLLEAAATGRAIIASDIPGCRETFEEGVTGFGCKAQDSQSLIDAIKKFMSVPYDDQIRMGQLGRRKMENEFDRKLVAKEYIEQINQIKMRRK
jgi:galacturonosyltransferase